jgi:GTP-binding protein
MIIDNVESPDDKSNEPLQMQITALDYSNFLGIIGIGKVKKGLIKKNQTVSIIGKNEKVKQDKVSKIMIFQGLHQKEVDEAFCGDIVALSGLDDLKISDTICDPEHLKKMPNLKIDEPTLSMIFQVNDSPFAGNDGKFVTSRVIKDRLDKEIKTNVALKVESTESADKFKVSGRGELHLSILIENMRREGFEIGVSSPDVIYKTIDGKKSEPFEDLILDIEEQHQGVVIEKLGERKAQLINLTPFENNKLRLNYEIPTRGLIGFRSEFLTLTSGTGIINHTFKEYKPCVTNINRNRKNGALISMSQGKAVPYALFNLQERGKLIIPSNIEVYEGMIIGFNSRENDLTVNPLKTKQLTNFRSSGADEAIVLTPETKITLEKAIEMINEDELIEVTPKEIRLRKRYLKEHERKKDQRSKN